MPVPCHKCDYDLTGCTAQHCPECGTRIDEGEYHRKVHFRFRYRAMWILASLGLIPIAIGTVLLIERGFATRPIWGLFLLGWVWIMFIFIADEATYH